MDRIADRDNFRAPFLETLKEFTDRAEIKPKELMDAVIKRINGSSIPSRDLKMAVLGFFNDLVRRGDLEFGDNDGNWSSDSFRLTENGERSTKNASRDPANPAGYLVYLQKESPLSDIPFGYVQEALETYRVGCHKATVFLIGAAVEWLILDVRDTLVSCLRATGKPVAGELNAWPVKTVSGALTKEILPKLKDDSKRNSNGDLKRLHDSAEARLSPITADFRQTRNDAGHPTSLGTVETKETRTP